MKEKNKTAKVSLGKTVKTLIWSLREYKKSSILAPVFVSFEVLLEVMIPFLMSYLIDRGINSGDMKQTIIFGFILVAAALISLVFGALAGKNSAIASAGFASNLRQDMFYNIQRFSFGNIDRFSSSSLITRMTKDVIATQEAYQITIRLAVRAPVMLVFAMIMAFTVNSKVSLIFLGTLPIIIGGLFIVMKFAHPLFEKMFKKYDVLNNVVEEDLLGMRVIKAYNREAHETDKFNDSSNQIYKISVKAEKLMAVTNPMMLVCIYGCMLFISWFSSRLIVTSGATEMTTGQLTSLISYVMQIMMSLLMVSVCIVFITISRAAAERISEVLSEEPTIHDPENAVTEIADGSIDFVNVSFKYSEKAERNALENVNIHISSGETVGIIGGTGSAKSTFVQLIPRLYDVTQGELLVGGKNVKEYGLCALRDNVAMVLQKNVLFSGTIKDNLRWGNEEATDEQLEQACKMAQADEFIRALPNGYDSRIEQGGSNVSGGQKQRLCIARALLKNPKILVLDDSTSAVDTRTDALIREAFNQVIPGTTKLIIAQRIASVEDADKIIVLDGGKISAVGTHSELMQTSEIYREVYTSQTKGGSEENE